MTHKNTYPQRSKSVEQRFWEKVDKTGGCWLWTSAVCTPLGHGCFWLNGGNVYPHRLVYEWAYGKIPKGLFVCHTCDNGGCVNPKHLFLGTHQDNMDDMARKGRAKYPGATNPRKGAKHHKTKLTELMVQRLRIVGDALPLSFYSKVTGVGLSALWAAIHGVNWKHLGKGQALA